VPEPAPKAEPVSKTDSQRGSGNREPPPFFPETVHGSSDLIPIRAYEAKLYGEGRCRIAWSTGRELNPRILVLQTSALATSPPVLILSL
jgi:hypothetical protein